MNGVRGRGDAQKGGGKVEAHAVDSSWNRAASELIEFLGLRKRKDPDDGAFV